MNNVGMYSLQQNPLNKPSQSCIVAYRPHCSTKSHESAFTHACTPKSGRHQLLIRDRWRCFLCSALFGVKGHSLEISSKSTNSTVQQRSKSSFSRSICSQYLKNRFVYEISRNVSYSVSTNAYFTIVCFVILHTSVSLKFIADIMSLVVQYFLFKQHTGYCSEMCRIALPQEPLVITACSLCSLVIHTV
jgi:hypothetical protein